MFDILEARGIAALLKDGAFKTAMLGAMIAWSVAGSYALKKAAIIPSFAHVYFGLGALAWGVSAVFFVELLRTGPLGLWGPAASIFQMGVVMVVSTFLLNETFSTGQWIATSVAITATGISMALSN